MEEKDAINIEHEAVDNVVIDVNVMLLVHLALNNSW